MTRDDRVLGWQWHKLDHVQTIRTTSRQITHQHLITQFLQAGCSSWRPTNPSVKALTAINRKAMNWMCLHTVLHNDRAGYISIHQTIKQRQLLNTSRLRSVDLTFLLCHFNHTRITITETHTAKMSTIFITVGLDCSITLICYTIRTRLTCNALPS